MGWDIKVWHEDLGDRTRLTIEAGAEVPEATIAAIAGAYWEEEVQYTEEWEEDDEFDEGLPGPPGAPHG